MSNSLDPDQVQHFVGPDLGPICFQRFSADSKSHHLRVKSLLSLNPCMIFMFATL